MENNEQTSPPSLPLSPIGPAAGAGLLSFAVVHWMMHPLVAHFHFLWVGLLAYAVLPLAVTFAVLHHSAWHREMARASRTICCVLLSGVILLGDLVFVTLLLAALSIFVNIGRQH